MESYTALLVDARGVVLPLADAAAQRPKITWTTFTRAHLNSGPQGVAQVRACPGFGPSSGR